MPSPKRTEVEIENEIKKRINHDSPSKNDLDFYVRKIRRIEGEFNIVQDQLSKMRIKLRRAEDFQMKHQILFKENQNLKIDIEGKDKSIYDMRSTIEKLKGYVEEKSVKDQGWALEKQNLFNQIDKWTQKAQQLEIKRVSDLAAERLKAEETIKKEKEFQKKDFEEREDQYKFQVRQLKKIIHEKETVQNIINNRVEKIRKEKDQEINRLIQVVEDHKEHEKKSIEDKNEEIDKLKEKFERMINFELENLKKNLDDQGEVFSIELNGLREIIQIKNDEITKLLMEVKSQANKHEEDRKEFVRDNRILKEKIYMIERESELQIYNMKERLSSLHSSDLHELKERYESIVENLRNDKKDMEEFLREKDRLREEDRKEHQRALNQLNDKIRERDHRISNLLDRIKESGDVNTGELKNLHQSFHKIEVEKESLSSDYQNNITFMTQQIAKLTTANQVKNIEIKKLYEEIHQIKKKYEEQIKEIEVRNKKERKQRDEERQRDRQERQRMNEEVATIEREFKNNERRLEREKDKAERERNKLQFIVQELEKDVDRLNKYIKQIDDNLKNQYKRNQSQILQGDGSKRQLTSTLEKQKVELETLKKIEVQQIQRKFEIQTTRVLNENNKLKTDLLNKSLAYENLESEFKKIEHQNRNMDKINKEKLLDYEKKMATLNNEINLTQNLYQAFMEAKARAKQ